jgi:hypothetical protein
MRLGAFAVGLALGACVLALGSGTLLSLLGESATGAAWVILAVLAANDLLPGRDLLPRPAIHWIVPRDMVSNHNLLGGLIFGLALATAVTTDAPVFVVYVAPLSGVLSSSIWWAVTICGAFAAARFVPVAYAGVLSLLHIAPQEANRAFRVSRGAARVISGIALSTSVGAYLIS